MATKYEVQKFNENNFLLWNTDSQHTPSGGHAYTFGGLLPKNIP